MKNMIDIWYFGEDSINSNAYLRYLALIRIGCKARLFNPYSLINSWKIKFFWKTGYGISQRLIKNWLINQLDNLPKPELIWINSGEVFGYDCLQYLRKFKAPIILYNNDDPTGGRDGHRFKNVLDNLALYDLCVVMREVNEAEYKSLGARKILRIWMSYDEVIHRKCLKSIKKTKDVTFIGTYRASDNRDDFILKLLRGGINLEIWGNSWNKSSCSKILTPYLKGSAEGHYYTQIIQESSINLGFLSSSNRDLHTRRSFEIPSVGGLLCAERTSEHQLLFEEGKEAMFWSSEVECIEVCKYLLSHSDERERICMAGMKKVRQLGVGNEDICRHILMSVL